MRQGKSRMSVMLEEEQCPFVTLTPALLHLRCQIKQGWNGVMGGRDRSEGGRERGCCKQAWHPAVTPSITTYVDTRAHTQRGLPPTANELFTQRVVVHIHRTLPKYKNSYTDTHMNVCTGRCTQEKKKTFKSKNKPRSRCQVFDIVQSLISTQSAGIIK